MINSVITQRKLEQTIEINKIYVFLIVKGNKKLSTVIWQRVILQHLSCAHREFCNRSWIYTDLVVLAAGRFFDLLPTIRKARW
jgi:hypothetical protein